MKKCNAVHLLIQRMRFYSRFTSGLGLLFLVFSFQVYASVPTVRLHDAVPEGLLALGDELSPHAPAQKNWGENAVAAELKLTDNLLLFPIANAAPIGELTVVVDGEVRHHIGIGLRAGGPDWWSFLDVSEFKGKTLQLIYHGKEEAAANLGGIRQGDELPTEASEPMYSERHRPQLHYSSKRGWVKDANGLIYHNGEYHLFHQHAPYRIAREAMHWGHAISTDLIHWEQQPPALRPYTLARGHSWSGSSITDFDNRSELGREGEAPLLSFFTDSPFGQSLAYSNDDGRSYQIADQRYVLPMGEDDISHDPRVFWYEPRDAKGRPAGVDAGYWAMVIFGHLPPETEGEKRQNAYLFYRSDNLIDWERTGEFPMDSFECPDLFPLFVDGDPDREKWVIYSVVGDYWIGHYDGATFVPETGPFKISSSKGNMLNAFQTFSHAPDGRRILMGAVGVPLPGMPFNQHMSLPVELSLATTPDGVRLHSQLIPEFDQLRRKSHTGTDLDPASAGELLADGKGDLFELELEVELNGAQEFTLMFNGTPAVYDAEAGVLRCNLGEAPLAAVDGRVALRVIVDRTVITAFGNEGAMYTVEPAILDSGHNGIQLDGPEGLRVRSLALHELKSIWE